ncbi:hypothetical protein NRY95_07815 [Xanthomonas campestris pv. phormiicola]|nr:hypothetical protein [Xanthomonas campestris pv. phormiicola]UYC17848.1 hypothetical protein NRY95_07815 [Xanthomonas campestris pv. phormiicola]
MSISSSLPLPGAAVSAPRAAVTDATAAQAALVKAAEQFESLFIAQMFKQMRQAAEAFGDGNEPGASAGNAAVLEHADWLVADSMSSRHAFGIADCLIAQMRSGAATTTRNATPAAQAAVASPSSFDPSGIQP